MPVNDATDEGLEFPYLQDGDGRKTYHAFTDELAVVAVLPHGTPYVTMAAPSLAGVVLDDPEGSLVINPSAPDSGRLSRQDLELVRDRLIPGANGSATAYGSIHVFELDEPPSEDLVEALAATAAERREVLELHLFNAPYGPHQDPHLFLGARLDRGLSSDARGRALALLSETARPHLGPTGRWTCWSCRTNCTREQPR